MPLSKQIKLVEIHNFKSIKRLMKIGPIKLCNVIITENHFANSHILEAICFGLGCDAMDLKIKSIRNIIHDDDIDGDSCDGKCEAFVKLTLTLTIRSFVRENIFQRMVFCDGTQIYEFAGKRISAELYTEKLTKFNYNPADQLFMGELYNQIIQMNAEEFFNLICKLSRTVDLQMRQKLTSKELDMAEEEYKLYSRKKQDAQQHCKNINKILTTETEKLDKLKSLSAMIRLKVYWNQYQQLNANENMKLELTEIKRRSTLLLREANRPSERTRRKQPLTSNVKPIKSYEQSTDINQLFDSLLYPSTNFIEKKVKILQQKEELLKTLSEFGFGKLFKTENDEEFPTDLLNFRLSYLTDDQTKALELMDNVAEDELVEIFKCSSETTTFKKIVLPSNWPKNPIYEKLEKTILIFGTNFNMVEMREKISRKNIKRCNFFRVNGYDFEPERSKHLIENEKNILEIVKEYMTSQNLCFSKDAEIVVKHHQQNLEREQQIGSTRNEQENEFLKKVNANVTLAELNAGGTFCYNTGRVVFGSEFKKLPNENFDLKHQFKQREYVTKQRTAQINAMAAQECITQEERSERHRYILKMLHDTQKEVEIAKDKLNRFNLQRLEIENQEYVVIEKNFRSASEYVWQNQGESIQKRVADTLARLPQEVQTPFFNVKLEDDCLRPNPDVQSILQRLVTESNKLTAEPNNTQILNEQLGDKQNEIILILKECKDKNTKLLTLGNLTIDDLIENVNEIRRVIDFKCLPEKYQTVKSDEIENIKNYFNIEIEQQTKKKLLQKNLLIDFQHRIKLNAENFGVKHTTSKIQRNELRLQLNDIEDEFSNKLTDFVVNFNIKLTEIYQSIYDNNMAAQAQIYVDPSTYTMMYYVKPPRGKFQNLIDLSESKRFLAHMAFLFTSFEFIETPLIGLYNFHDYLLERKEIEYWSQFLLDQSLKKQIFLISKSDEIRNVADSIIGIIANKNFDSQVYYITELEPDD